jgi:hypothetical protein
MTTNVNLQLSFAPPKTELNALSDTKSDVAVAAGSGEALENPVVQKEQQTKKSTNREKKMKIKY